MKKILLLVFAMLGALCAEAITVKDVCGTWKTSGTYLFNESYDEVTFVDETITEGTCTITQNATAENSVTIRNLLGDDNTTMTGTVDVASGTITVTSSTEIWSYYTMCGSDGKSAPVLTIASDGKTLSIQGATFTYSGIVYGKECNLTLTRDSEPEPEPEAKLLWSQDGYAWSPTGEKLGAVKLQLYDDSTYVVTDWMGTAGYDMEFKVVKDSRWTSLMSIQNAYEVKGSYYYVSAGTLKEADPICYAGMYTANGYSAIYGLDDKRIAAPDWEGGYLNVYTYAYDSDDKPVFAGYYYVTWGPEYRYTVKPYRNNYQENMQTQTSQTKILNQEDFEATMKVYKNGTYILKNWEGVEGYDLKFKLGNQDSLTVLNDNATEVVTSKGTRYWRVPTGRSDYDRACIYQNSSIYNTLDIHGERANVVFGCSYLYPNGSNKGTMAYYAVRGFNPDTIRTVSMRECIWNNEQETWADTISFNRNEIDSVKVYTLTDASDSTYYYVPDFLGRNADGLGSGDLMFGLYGGEISGPQLLCLSNQTSMGYTYYYYMHGNSTGYDCCTLNYFYSSDADFANDGSLIFDIWYQPVGKTSSEGRYTYYCLNLDKSRAQGDVNGDGAVDIADVNAVLADMNGGTSTGYADVNGDGAVDIADVNAVLKIMGS